MDDALPPPPPSLPPLAPPSQPVPPARPAPSLPPLPISSIRSSRRTGRRIAALIALLAFLVGLGVMAVALRGYDRYIATKTPPIVALPVAAGKTPVVIVPGSVPAPTIASTIDLTALTAREAALDARLGTLETRTARVSSEAQAASDYATRAEGMMLAFAARRAIDRGLELGYVEGQLHDRFDATQPGAVATIVQAAHTPVTLETLRAGLEALAPELATGAASTGWWSSLGRQFSNLVVVHQNDVPSPLPTDRLDRARHAVAGGQIEAALFEVSHMPGAAAARRWTDAARRYLRARQALDTLEQAALSTPAAPVPVPQAQPTAPIEGATR